jgi:hypothetical protein
MLEFVWFEPKIHSNFLQIQYGPHCIFNRLNRKYLIKGEVLNEQNRYGTWAGFCFRGGNKGL